MSSRKLAIIIILSFLVGVFLSPDIFIDYVFGSVCILLLLAIIFLLRNSKLVWLGYILIGFFSGSLFFLFFSQNFISKKGFQDNVNYKLTGIIASYPQEKEKSITFVFNVDNQNIYVSVPKIGIYTFGQNITVEGKVNKIENEDSFDFKEYFLSRNISYQMFYPKIGSKPGNSGNIFFRILFFFRKIFEDTVNKVFIRPYSSFVLGLLLGVKSLSSEFMDKLSLISISHIVVVSGYNLSIIAEAIKGIFSPYSRRLSFWVPMIGIWFFTIMVGAEPPVARAAIMASVLLISKKSGKKADGISLVLLTAVVMVFINPYVLRYDPGFQLSFLSTLGIIILCDDFGKFFKRIKIPFWISEIMSATLSAQLFILPVISFYFGRVSIIGPVANFIILPFVPLVMLLSFIATLLGMLNLNIAIIFSNIPTLILFCILKLSDFLSGLSFSSLSLKVSFVGVVLYFIIGGLLYSLLGKRYVKKNN